MWPLLVSGVFGISYYIYPGPELLIQGTGNQAALKKYADPVVVTVTGDLF